MNKRLIIDLLRHGACHDGDIYRGRTDSLLSEQGWQQMDRAFGAVASVPYQALFSSPLQRCLLPAQQLSQRLELPLKTDVRLCEIDFGDWDGQLYAKVWQHSQQQVLDFWDDPSANPPPSGESLQALQCRLREFVAQQLEPLLQGEPQSGCADTAESVADRYLLCLCHGGVIRTLLTQLLDMPFAVAQKISLDYGSLTRIELYLDAASTADHQSQLIFLNRIPDLENYR